VFNDADPRYLALKQKYKEYPTASPSGGLKDLPKIDLPPELPLTQAETEKRLAAKAEQNIRANALLKTRLLVKDKLQAILPMLKAAATGKEVSADRQIKRLEICSECTNASLIDGKPACGICGCALKIGDKSIVNLISLEETDLYGCKHVDGSQWKEAGV
jgi:hypothetical protein